MFDNKDNSKPRDVLVKDLGDETSKKLLKSPDFKISKRASGYTEVTIIPAPKKIRIYHKEGFDMKHTITPNKSRPDLFDLDFMKKVYPGSIKYSCGFSDDDPESFIEQFGLNHLKRNREYSDYAGHGIAICVMEKEDIKPVYKEGVDLSDLNDNLCYPVLVERAFKEKPKDHVKGCKCDSCDEE